MPLRYPVARGPALVFAHAPRRTGLLRHFLQSARRFPVGVFGTIDPSTGAVTTIGPNTPNLSHDLAVSPSGVVYAIFGDSLYTIDKTTGIASSAIGVLPADLQSIAFRPDGVLFGVTGSDL